MSESAPNGEERPRRERPSHWAHPVDEDRRHARARSQRRRRIVLAVLLLVVAGLAGWYLYVTSDASVGAYAEQYLEDLLGTDVRIGRASFSWGKGLVLEDLRIIPPAPFAEPVLAAEQVDLRIRPLSLLLRSPQVTEIVVHRPQITLVQLDEGRWNFQALSRSPRRPAALGTRPVVALEEGTLRIERRIAGEPPYAHQMVVWGLLLPSEASPDRFRFQTDVKSQGVHLAVASGLIDTRAKALAFEGQASNVALTEELYRSLPREAQRIWDRFELTGPGNSVNVKVLFDETDGFRLGADLTGVSFTHQYKGIPYRFENLTGRCAFGVYPPGRGARLTLTGVQGLVNGVPVRLSGWASGFDQERLAMDLEVEADHVDFGPCRASLVALAPETEAIYETYQPRGQFDVALRLLRPDPNAPLEVTGVATCRDVEMTYSQFPYRLEHMRGTVRFGPDGFKSEDLSGQHGQTAVRMEGWAKNPGPLMETQMQIRATNLVLDEDLRAALAPPHRRLYDLYAPAGTADAEVAVYRAPERDAQPEIAVHLALVDCQFKPAGFPYLLTGATGEINIWPGRAELVEIRGRHGQARIAISGEVLSPPGQELPEVRLAIVGQDVPLDEDLHQALPEREQAVMQSFHLLGLADLEGTVTTSPETGGRLEYDLDIGLKNARMIYEPFPFQAEQLTGRLHLAKGTCRVESLVGFNSGARIEARGWIEQRPDDYALDLMLAGTDVVLGESLRGALGPEMRSVWSHLAPRGRVDLQAHLVKAFGPEEAIRHHVWVTARDVQMRLDLFPYPLEHVTGQLEFEGSEVQLHDVKARTGMTEFGLSGRIAYSKEGPELDLAIRTKGLRMEGPLRDALPGPLAKAFDIIQPTGRVDLAITRLVFRSAGPGSPTAGNGEPGTGNRDGTGPTCEWTGSAILDEVGASPGVKVAGVVGTAELQGRWADGKVALQGQMRIQQGKIADKDISETRLLIEKPAAASTVSIKGIEGEFYGGRVEGFATIRLEPSIRYAMNVSAVDVDFERLLREGFRLEHNLSGGRMRATLGLWAKGPDAQDVEAAGYADVTEARLYELPPIVRVLNALRLAPADQTAFEKGRVLYFLRGRRLYLGDIRLQGRAVSLFGAGILEPDGKIDMTFLTGKHNDDPLIPALSELGEGLRHELAVVVVSGTLAEPQVEVRTLSSLTAPFRELLNMVREQRQREAEAKADPQRMQK
ncbi:MAG: hypothetical protein IMZ44_23065 [Planctomycetes bacterium]|nr:hypothetical protein [Planctomycetota bacterium]